MRWKFVHTYRWYILTLLFLVCVGSIIWVAIWDWNKRVLRISFLDIGQGDAIFIETPNKNQILIDSGRDGKILRELGKVMSFWDRSIDLLIPTHPDTDHIGGFPDVLERYRVDAVLESGVLGEAGAYQAMNDLIAAKEIQRVEVRRGMIIDLDQGVTLEILFPDREVETVETNDASIVARLVFGETEILFTGDSPKKIEEYLISLDATLLDADVLKVGHHGSDTSTGELFVSAVSPEFAVISAGKGNSYGHPHKEVLDILKNQEVTTFITSRDGRLVMESDGQRIWWK